MLKAERILTNANLVYILQSIKSSDDIVMGIYRKVDIRDYKTFVKLNRQFKQLLG